jgi:hypothetical protein
MRSVAAAARSPNVDDIAVKHPEAQQQQKQEHQQHQKE